MGEGSAKKPDDISASRQYLDYLSDRLAEVKAKREALNVYYKPIDEECKKIGTLILSIKRQIVREEEGVNSIDDVEPTEPVEEYKYSVSEPKYK